MRTNAAGVIPFPANAKAGDYLLMVGVTLWRELEQSPASYLESAARKAALR
ncbi:MAG: hypothetical protein H0W66_03265 [Chthoniobacterales bacterium]|nr:hypothetical protein [Chthoniobacterales bacterium]